MKILLVDLDDTLINTTEFRKKFQQEIAALADVPEEKIEDIYHASKNNKTDWEKSFLDDLVTKTGLNEEKVFALWNKQLQTLTVNKKILELVKKSSGKKIIFSVGDVEFQRKKIELLHLEEYFDDLILIPTDKVNHLAKLLKENIDFQNAEITLIDDKQTIIDRVKKELPSVTIFHPQEVAV